MPITVNCKACGKEFKTYPRSIRKGQGKYCSSQCWGKTKRNKIERTCEICEKKFFTIPWKLRNGIGKYCSKPCARRGRHGEEHHNWRGGSKEASKRSFEKMKNNLRYRLNRRIGNGIRRSVCGKGGRHWECLVGYDLDRLKRRLKRTMPVGYSWQDFIEGKLHIDHIIPRSAFKFEAVDDIGFRYCWALSNLQLLPAAENIRKHAKIEYPFQMVLGS